MATTEVDLGKEAPAKEPITAQGNTIPRLHIPLIKDERGPEAKIGLLEYILTKEADPRTKEEQEKASSQGVTLGRKYPPFNVRACTEFITSNVHHSACIQAKANATVGLGFAQPGEKNVSQVQAQGRNAPGVGLDPTALRKPGKADTALDPLCEISWGALLTKCALDYWGPGFAAMEVVRAKGDGKTITGLHHIPAAEIYLYMENVMYQSHFEIMNTEGWQSVRHFAKWGDSQGFIDRVAKGAVYGAFDLPTGGGMGKYTQGQEGLVVPQARVSEVIFFPQPSALSRWYGFPDWISCTTSIELVRALHQYKFDFFLNRGVPEFMFFLLGQQLEPTLWAKIEQSLQAATGSGNSHKTIALNLANPEIKIRLEKLAVDAKGDDDLSKTKESMAADIVTAHGVPPLLAGIQIPGKLGSTNELPNALMAFQLLKIAPAQRFFQRILAKTLGDSATNGGLALSGDDFFFREITEVIDIAAMNTVGSMKQTPMQAAAEGRDLSAGPKS